MKRSLRRWLVVLAVASAAGTGCYRKVVSAQGFGADHITVEKGDAPPEKGTRTLGYPKYTPKSMPGD